MFVPSRSEVHAMPRKTVEPSIPRKAKAPRKKRVAANGYKLPDHIQEGEILQDIMKQRWRIGRSIGSGGFGEIYLASAEIDRPVQDDAPFVVKIEPHTNGPLFVEINFYLKVAKKEMIEAWMKARYVKFLGMPKYIGSGSHIYREEKYRFLVMERFGSNLQKLFEENKRSFHLSTVLKLGKKILCILHYIHDNGFVHADIKGSNLLCGFLKGTEQQVYLVDFGLATHYTKDGKHKENKPDPKKAHDGTIEFLSRDAHTGVQSRRGDLEILGYNMVQWLCGRLPWEDRLSDPHYVQMQKSHYMSDIPAFMKKCFPDGNHPVVIERYLNYVAGLEFEAKPDYSHCCSLLTQALKENGFSDDEKLDFTFLSSAEVRSPRRKGLLKKKPVEEKTHEESPAVVTKNAKASPAARRKQKPEKIEKKRFSKKKKDSNLYQPVDTSPANPTPAMLELMLKKKASAVKKPQQKKVTCRIKNCSSSTSEEATTSPTPVTEDSLTLSTPESPEIIYPSSDESPRQGKRSFQPERVRRLETRQPISAGRKRPQGKTRSEHIPEKKQKQPVVKPYRSRHIYEEDSPGSPELC